MTDKQLEQKSDDLMRLFFSFCDDAELDKYIDEEEGLKTFKVTERYIKEDTWIVNAINKEEATDIAMSVDPDTSEVLEVTSTTTEPLEKS